MEQLKHWKEKPQNRRGNLKANSRGKAKNNNLSLLFIICIFILSGYAHSQSLDKGKALYEAGRFEQAVSEYRAALDSLQSCCADTEKGIIDSVQIHLGQTLYLLAKEYSAKGDTIKALEAGIECAEVRYKVLGETHKDYHIALHNLAIYYDEAGNVAEAIKTGEEVVRLRRVYLPDDPYFASSLFNMAIYYAASGDYEAAIQSAEEAAAIQKKLPEEQDNYISTINKLISYYSEIKQYDKAIEMSKQKVAINLERYGENSKEYRNSLWNLGYYYSLNNEYEKAIEKSKKAAEIVSHFEGEESADYAQLMYNISYYYAKLNNLSNTISYGQKLLEIRRKLWGNDDQRLASLLNDYGVDCKYAYRYEDAEKLMKEALAITEKNLGKDNEEYVRSCYLLSRVYIKWGNKLADAVEYAEQAMQIRKKLFGESDLSYIAYVGNLATVYSVMGNYNKALEFHTMASELTSEYEGENSEHFIEHLILIAIVHNKLKDYQKSLEWSTKAVEMASEFFGEKSAIYTKAGHQLALSYRNTDNFEKAIELAEKLLPIYEETTGKITDKYAVTVHSLSNYYYNFGRLQNDSEPYFKKALSTAKEAVEIRRTLLGEKHSDFASSLLHLSTSYTANKDYDNAAKCYRQAMDICVNNIIDNFRDMTSSERESYWNYAQWIFKTLNHYCYHSKGGNKTWQEAAYDGAIFVKGLLLNSEIELSNLLLESGDQEVVEQYNKLKMMRNELKSLRSTSSEKQQTYMQSLEKEIAGMERELVKKSKAYGDYTRNLSLHWQDVRDALKDDEIAIEFIEVKDITGAHAALILKKDSEYPEMVKLFTQLQLDTLRLEGSPLRFKDAIAYETGMSKDLIYRTKELGEIIWSPLEEHLKGIKHIYFSPSGIFHQIAIEYLPMNNGSIYDRFNLHRLSSTKQLVLKDKDIKQQKSVLYGGLDYNIALSGDVKPDNTSTSEPETYTVNALRSSGISAAHLPGTKKEVNSIYNTLSAKELDVSVYTDKMGTEESFKSLSGKNINLLHIATHGFYLTEEQSDQQMQFLSSGLGEAPAEEDRTLSRSGLLMSGANIRLKGQELPNGAEDGILTAREIANLDLRGLDLLVLSACQTGLGEVTGEGVFGLQRGFKKAGAQTIVMSLWNVNDKATEIMMSRFYENLAKGQSKREAFVNAQSYLKQYQYEVKETEGAGYLRNRKTVTRTVKFDNPKYWAAFILLD